MRARRFLGFVVRPLHKRHEPHQTTLRNLPRRGVGGHRRIARQPEAWLRAIEKEGLPWSNISNLDGWQTGFDSYGIQSLPSFVLIRCSDGQIVARKPWGRASHIPVGEIEKLLGQ